MIRRFPEIHAPPKEDYVNLYKLPPTMGCILAVLILFVAAGVLGGALAFGVMVFRYVMS